MAKTKNILQSLFPTYLQSSRPKPVEGKRCLLIWKHDDLRLEMIPGIVTKTYGETFLAKTVRRLGPMGEHGQGTFWAPGIPNEKFRPVTRDLFIEGGFPIVPQDGDLEGV